MVEQEKGLLSLILLNNSDYVFDYLNPDAFQNLFCKSCYEIFLEEYRQKQEHDPVVLIEKLKLKYPDYLEKDIREHLKDIVSADTQFYGAQRAAENLMNDYNARLIRELLSVNINGSNVYTEIERLTHELQKIKSPASAGMDMSEYVDAFADRYFSGKEIEYFKTGFSMLDEMLFIDRGDMVVIGARPAVGKSAFAIQMAEQIADMDKQILYFNLEMTDEQIYERMLATETGFPLFKIKRTLRLSDEKEKQIVNDAKERIRQRKIRVVTGSQKVSEIRQVSRRIKPDIVIVDYLQLVQSDANYNGNRYAEVGQISHDLKALALELKIPVVVLTQLNRVAKATTEPSMNEIRESGDIEQDASVIILLWNTDETDYSKKGIKVDKNRQGQLNKWENRFEFDGNSMRFVDVETFHKAKDDEIATITGGDLPLLETETQEQNFREIIVEHIEDAESEIIENTENDSEIAETEITEIAENKEKINFDDVEFTPIGEEKPPF